ncbi:hypothetical protein K3N28_22450 [Glycomyces sp. TRM65418]|uniref:hypothetical protein n=1 Tax=Glycomyces sp. TRM65418 TaxID=2867006 RepID=UPI001CE5319B|nr:hypothetical protein [Glycomyces sp. TRM65418]MCC3765824.1 hypothetical protein [Glycomyces sp. TRM65418]QZD55410.1 hypothetical protein K3N28_22330 [Glycomyces sp. TRM65418]
MNMQTSRVRRSAGLTDSLIGALLVTVLAACGSGGGGAADTAEPSTSAAPTALSPSPEATVTEETTVPDETTPYLDPSLGDSSKPGSASQTTISGTVEAGVESGCLVLEHDGTVYGIFGNYDSSIVYAGAKVTLHGQIDKGMMSTCQQGTPFVVEDAETAD